MDQTTKPDTSAAATDVPEFISDLDGGQFDRMLSIALSKVAAAVVDREKKGKVDITLTMEPIKGTHQVRIAHTIKFTNPTMQGKVAEEASGATVVFVGRFGALSLAQPSLFDKQGQQGQIPT